MSRTAARVLVLALAAVAGGADIVRGQSLEGLLREFADERSAPAGVRVEGRLERAGGATELVVTLTPEGGARLVADPGIQVVPLPGPAGPWTEVDRVERVERDRAYFEPFVELRVPIAAGAVGEASAEVAYAWCMVDRICLFGHAIVAVPLAEAGG